MSETRRVCLVTPSEFKSHWMEVQQTGGGVEIAGLLNWPVALGFPLAVHTVDEDLSDYDIIITNMSSTESEYVPHLKRAYPEAMVVVCLDYAFDILEQYGGTPMITRILTNLRRADRVFSVHPHQTAWLRAVAPGLPVWHIPHPVDVEGVRRVTEGVPRRDRKAVMNGKVPLRVVVMWHQYDDRYLGPFLLCKALEQEWNRPIEMVVAGLKSKFLQFGTGIPESLPHCPTCGATGTGIPHPPFHTQGCPVIRPAQDPESGEVLEGKWERMLGVPGSPGLVVEGLTKELLDTGVLVVDRDRRQAFDIAIPYTSPGDWFAMLSSADLVIDANAIGTIGRVGIETAVLGVPYIAGRNVLSARKLWPKLILDDNNPEGVKTKLKKMLTDEGARKKALKFATRAVEDEFGLAIAAERFWAMVNAEPTTGIK